MQVSNASSQEQEIPALYAEAQVWRTKFRSTNEILVLKKLIDAQDISVWNLSPTQADFLINADKKVMVNRILNSHNLNHTVLILDVQRRVDSLRVEPTLWNENTLRIGYRLNWKEYPTLRIFEEYIAYLEENFPSICKIESIGTTAEYRTIQMIKISNGNPDNKAVIITSGMHAREWAAITSSLYVLNSIVTNFDQLPPYMKNKEWVFIPLLNPDGYEYSHTRDRLWRKNRRKFNKCNGVDLNRNFDIHWDLAAFTIKHECSESYSGPKPFSEAETLALQNVIETYTKKTSALLDLHSYGQLILYPWSAKPHAIPDKDLLSSTAEALSQAIRNATKQKYNYGATYHMIYPATGAGIDYVYSKRITLSLAIEVRDKESHGFLLPARYIEDTGKDIFAAAKQLAKMMDQNIQHRKSHGQPWF